MNGSSQEEGAVGVTWGNGMLRQIDPQNLGKKEIMYLFVKLAA
jgi:hypothetical protein